jgi:geranylgeranyl pyrophosphate synthase
MVQESNIIDEAFDVALDFRNRALAALEPIPACEAKDSLIDVAYWVTQRRS